MLSKVKAKNIPTVQESDWKVDDALTAIHDGDLRAGDLLSYFDKEIEKKRVLNAYITVTSDLARKQAKATDRRRKRGRLLPLDGIPIAIKDNFCTKGVLTTAGSKILSNFVPTYESTVTKRLLDAGAVFLGKTNMDEFGMGSSTENSFFGPTLNPRAFDKGKTNVVPGGSSGGSAAAVAANLCIAAIGTDTGGSIRNPASYCGIVGMKPTYGLCSRRGIVAYGSSLDQAGVLTKTVEDAAMLLDVIVGHDPNDSTSFQWPKGSFTEILKKPITGMRIGIPNECRNVSQTQDTERVWAAAEHLIESVGAKCVKIALPTIKYALPAYYIIALSEASSNLARYDGVRYGYRASNVKDLLDLYEKTREEGFGHEVKKRIMLGTYCLSAGYYDQYYDKALRVRSLIAQEFRAAFETVDVMVWPTTPSAAFELGSRSSDPIAMYLEDVFTVPVNLAGLPALSLPVATGESGLPLGLSIVGPKLGDDYVLKAALVFEKALKSSIS